MLRTSAYLNAIAGKRRRTGAFTLVEVIIVVVIIGLLVAIAVPHFLRHRAMTHKNVCISHLRQINAAKAVWAQANNKSNSDFPVESDLFGTTNYLKAKPRCPAGGADYMETIGSAGVLPACSLSNLLGHAIGQ